MDALRAEHLTFLTDDQLGSLVACVRWRRRPAVARGSSSKAGTAQGGSAIAMALAKATERPLEVYDVFGMIPPPTEEDGPDVRERYQRIVAGEARGLAEGEEYYGYRDDLLAEVTASFARHGVPVDEHRVTLVRGLFQDTLTGTGPVALAHVDGDWYDSTTTCLSRRPRGSCRAGGSWSTTTSHGRAAARPWTSSRRVTPSSAPRCGPRSTSSGDPPEPRGARGTPRGPGPR